MKMSVASMGNATTHHLAAYSRFYEPGVLVPAAHCRLVEQLDNVSGLSNVPSPYIYRYSMSQFCSTQEREWVRNIWSYRNEGVAGLCYIGAVPRVEDRCFSIAGALLRNFIDARVYPLQEVLSRLKDGVLPKATVIAVPDFFNGLPMPDWQVANLRSWLLSRYSAGLQTVLAVSDLGLLEKAYSKQIAEAIETRFFQVIE
jgi:hypothetical protein